MSIWTQIVKWFLRYAWPSIQELLIKLLEVFMDRIWEIIINFMDKRNTKQQEYAEQQKEKAEQSARNATAAYAKLQSDTGLLLKKRLNWRKYEQRESVSSHILIDHLMNGKRFFKICSRRSIRHFFQATIQERCLK